jgi:hypothetical protein
MPSLEHEIAALNGELVALALAHADELAEYFDERSPAMADIRSARMISIGPRLPVPPGLLPRTVIRRLYAAHAAFRAALEAVFDSRMAGSWGRLAEELRLDGDVRRYLDQNRRPKWATICRPDVVVHGNTITMVEPNVGSSCGAMPDADVLGRLFEAAPVIGDQLRRIGASRQNAMAAMAAFLRQRLRDAARPADSLVVVTEFRSDFDLPDFYHCDLFAAELRRHGLRAEACAVEDLRVGEHAVTFHGERCGLVYRMWGEQPDPAGQYEALATLIDAGRTGAVALVEEITDQIAGNKTVLAFLSEELDAATLPPALTEALRGFVPWTRLLEDAATDVDGEKIELLPWVLAHQECLILKPGAGFHGRGVTLGCEVDRREWAATLDGALEASEPWLVQRLAVSQLSDVAACTEGELAAGQTFVDYGYYAIGATVPAAAIRRHAPFPGVPTRRVKRAGIGPVFFV